VRVALGDWTPLVRDAADLIRLAYLVAAVVCFATGNGVRFLITFAAALAPRLLNVPRVFDYLFTVTIGLQAWGNTWDAFHNGDVFDRIDHASSTMGVAPLFYLWFVRTGLLPHPREKLPTSRHVGLVVIGFCIGLSVGAIYEVVEWLGVRYFASGAYVSETDTVMDLLMDGTGALIGSLLLVGWAIRGWHPERRVSTQSGFETSCSVQSRGSDDDDFAFDDRTRHEQRPRRIA
jgi:hypothetical protein